MEYQLLNQKHPSYDADRLHDLQALYEGGEAFEKRLTRFLAQQPSEPDQLYAARIREAHYRNYFGPIIDYLAALLFQKPPDVKAYDADDKHKPDRQPLTTLDPYWESFRDDADGNGCDLETLLRDRFVQALVGRCSYLLLDHPPEIPVESKREFQELGIGHVTVTPIETLSVFDWEETDRGELVWALVHEATQRRASVSASRKEITETWRVYTAATVETYQITYDPTKNRPQPDTDVPRIGEPTPHRFGKVPLVRFAVPKGLWLGQRLKSPQLAHFRTSNAQLWGIKRSCYPTPVLKIREADARKGYPQLGHGYGITLATDEEFSWSSPGADTFSSVEAVVASLKDEIYRIATQMALGVDNNAAAVGRSGDSKAQDSAATKVLLKVYGEKVRELWEYLHDTIAVARGEKIDFAVEGYRNFAIIPAGDLITSAAEVQTMGGIPSHRFNVELKTRIATELLPDLDEQARSEIRKEIEDGVAESEELAAATREAMLLGMEASKANGDDEDASAEDDERAGGKPAPPGSSKPGSSKGKTAGKAKTPNARPQTL